MKLRTAKKILRRWSRCFPADLSPVHAHYDGILPWTWGQWREAHRVWVKAIGRGLVRLRSTHARAKP